MQEKLFNLDFFAGANEQYNQINILRDNKEILSVLLKDRSTKKNIIWGTNSYSFLGKHYSFKDQIKMELITGDNSEIIRSRVEKELVEQKIRTKRKAEVFTPFWIIQKQIDLIDNTFDKNNLEEYLSIKWLEIACGEAPYLVSRYDTVSGNEIELFERKGVLDRKMQLLLKQEICEKDWHDYSELIYKSCYGYEFQGDSLLIARENLLYSYIEYFTCKFKKNPKLEYILKIANIITYNVFQMDGLSYNIPCSDKTEEEEYSYQLNLFEDVSNLNEFYEKNDEISKVKIKDWSNNKLINFESIILKKGAKKMKFDVVIGNPPYQDESTGDGTQTPPIYHHFMEEAYKISDKVLLITPARFLFNAGATPKAWNSKMLNDPNLKVVFYEQNSSLVFPNTDIKGGVAITYRDVNENFGPIETFVQYKELIQIKHKVWDKFKESFSELVFGQNIYLYTDKLHIDFPNAESMLSKGHKYDIKSNAFDRLSFIFYDEKPNDEFEYIRILGRQNNKRVYKWMRKDYICNHIALNTYNVVLAKANGTGKLGEILSSPIILEPGVATTETFISIGAFESLKEAESVLKYISTKFARALLGILKITQDNLSEKWRFVPKMNFSNDSEINWSNSIKEIDKQLFEYFNLTEDELGFISNNIKEMGE